MIDLGADITAGGSCLQTCLVVEGAEIRIETGFRAWIRFGRVLREEGVIDPRVLAGEPVQGWQAAAVEFYADREEVPRGRGGGRAFDMDVDAPRIVAAFVQAYGIDLTDPALDMHWHLFQALLRAIPAETQLARVMGYRSWTKADEKKKPETRNRELREMWALPEGPSARDDAAVAYQMAAFGDVTGGDA